MFERQHKNIFHLLIHSINAHDNWGWTRVNLDPGSSSEFATWVARTQALGPTCAVLTCWGIPASKWETWKQLRTSPALVVQPFEEWVEGKPLPLSLCLLNKSVFNHLLEGRVTERKKQRTLDFWFIRQVAVMVRDGVGWVQRSICVSH